MEKKKSHKMTPKGKVQDSEKVESKGSVTPVKKNRAVLGDDINLSEHCAGLSFLLKKRPPNKKGDVLHLKKVEKIQYTSHPKMLINF